MLVLRFSHWDNWDGFFWPYFLSKNDKRGYDWDYCEEWGAGWREDPRAAPERKKNAIFF